MSLLNIAVIFFFHHHLHKYFGVLSPTPLSWLVDFVVSHNKKPIKKINNIFVIFLWMSREKRENKNFDCCYEIANNRRGKMTGERREKSIELINRSKQKILTFLFTFEIIFFGAIFFFPSNTNKKLKTRIVRLNDFQFTI